MLESGILRVVVAVLLGGAAIAGSNVAAASPGDEPGNDGCPTPEAEYTPESLPEGVNVLRCGLVGEVVTGYTPGGVGLGVEVPYPGDEATLYVHGITSSLSGSFTVSVDASGVVSYPDAVGADSGSSAVTTVLDEELALLRAEGAAASDPDVCRDRAYNRLGHSWYSNDTWCINHANRPSNITAGQAEEQIRAGKNNVAGSDNDCGRADNVNRDATYGGTTSVNPNIYLDAEGNVNCGANSDSISVVGFGRLPEGVLGVSCPKRSSLDSKQLVADDIRINQDSSTFTLTPDALGCVSRYDLQALVTHEFGHYFGLRHVSESKHPLMTMSPLLGPCTAAERTLGLGDMLGLESLY